MRTLSLLLTFLCLILVTSAQTKARRLADLNWLSGCWENGKPDKGDLLSEQWMKPAGGMMIGMGRTVRDGRAQDWEFLRIEQRGDDVVYIARPKANATDTVFNAVTLTATEVIFENKGHDFPQRVIYRISGDALTGRIEGTMNGNARGIDFPMTRAKCN